LLDETFNSGSDRGTNDEVFSLALQSDSGILVGGNFTRYNGVTAATDSILRLNNITSADPGAGSKKTVSSLPATGFNPSSVTSLPAQPLEKAYVAYSALQIEIPAIQLKIPIVGVPLTENGWDVSWLGSNAGWLNGTAFPTLSGNSLITGHVWDATNQPGPFLLLKSLKYGDQVRIHAWGQIYIYEVRENLLVSPLYPEIALKHEKLAWVTLLTCEDYNNLLKSYAFRRMVRAALIDVVPAQ
jgi:LPXTG-site transpeptidase (sortase) family protein